MPAVAAIVRRTALPLACLLTFGATAGAQIAIQVKSGTVWTANVELKVLGPLTFRWRWDGAETPTGVAWQVATVTPTSTVTTRATDVIASETGMRLSAPGGVKGGSYEEFTVTPATTWPAKFYIRVRVNVGRKSVYSRWTTVTVVGEKASLVETLTCEFKAWKWKTRLTWSGKEYYDKTAFSHGRVVEYPPWTRARVDIMIKNTSSTEVRYERDITLWKNGAKIYDDPSYGNWSPQIKSLSAGETYETQTYENADGAFYPDGVGTDVYDINVVLTPLERPGTKCSFRFYSK